jgi:hypothetical protein
MDAQQVVGVTGVSDSGEAKCLVEEPHRRAPAESLRPAPRREGEGGCLPYFALPWLATAAIFAAIAAASPR